MAKKDFSSRLHDAVENYYHYNPDTLMPLMMVALAANGKLRIAAGTSIPENAACVLIPQEIIGYDWVELDAPLKRRVNKWIKDGVTTVAVDMEIGRSLLQIYKTLKNNDEYDVIKEDGYGLANVAATVVTLMGEDAPDYWYKSMVKVK